MLDELEIREPPEESWISLTVALTWIEFQHSLEIQELLERITAEQSIEEESIRLCLQGTWRNLADQASQGQIEMRARIFGDRVEQRLGIEEFRNNRFLGWVERPDAGMDVMVERHDGNYEGEWDRRDDTRGNDFHYVVVRRHELLRLNPRPLKSVRRRQVSAAEARRAGEWLKEQLQTRVPKSVTKGKLLEELHSVFDISSSQAAQLWREASLNHPDWSVPGPPRKIDSV